RVDQAIWSDLAHAGVIVIADVDISGSIDGNTEWTGKLGRYRGSTIAAETERTRSCHRRDPAVGTDLADSFVIEIGDKQVAGRIAGDTHGPYSGGCRRHSVAIKDV